MSIEKNIYFSKKKKQLLYSQYEQYSGSKNCIIEKSLIQMIQTKFTT